MTSPTLAIPLYVQQARDALFAGRDTHHPLRGWLFTVTVTNPHEAVATIHRDRNEHMPLVPSYDINGTIIATGRDSAEAVEKLAAIIHQ